VMADFVIQEMTQEDWEHVRSIFVQGIATGNATFEEEAPATWKKWDATHLKFCRLVALADNRVIGWAALSPVSWRDCYQGVAEATVYVKFDSRGKGVGRTLMHALIEQSEAKGIWTLQSMVFPENQASLALLKDVGFRPVGVRERIGSHKGTWRNVVLLERRSQIVGCD
jgi:L-amino acid N-acyltransferase YncA